MLKLLAPHKLKVVWHFHSTAGRNLLQRIKDVVKVRLFGNFFVHRFIAVGDGVAGNALERGFSPGKIITNQNGIDIQRFSPDQMERKRAREALGVSKEETVFLHLGYDPVTKGVDVFVKAAEMFRNNVVGKALFVIVGRNETRDYVSRMFRVGNSNPLSAHYRSPGGILVIFEWCGCFGVIWSTGGFELRSIRGDDERTR